MHGRATQGEDQGQEIHPQELTSDSGCFENGIWASPGHLPSQEVHSKSEPHDVYMVMCISFIYVHCLYLNSIKLRLYYMHVLYCRVPKYMYLSLYQNNVYHTQQGLAKYSDRASEDFFRSTNHKGG